MCESKHPRTEESLSLIHIYIFAPDEVLSYPENGMYANETYFFSGPHAAEHLRVRKGFDSGATAVLLTSDGCGDSLYDPVSYTHLDVYKRQGPNKTEQAAKAYWDRIKK